MYIPQLGDTKPIYRALYFSIRKDISGGVLSSGFHLPSKRRLSGELGISINTVDTAYQQLVSEGYLISKPQKGFFVRTGFSENLLPDTDNHPDYIYLSASAKTSLNTSENMLDFSPNGSDLSLFPISVIRRSLKKELENRLCFTTCPPQGSERLRNALAIYLQNARGLFCSPAQILIGAGTDYLLQLLIQILRIHTNDKISIAMENPIYNKAYRIFAGLFTPVSFIPLDAAGIDMDILKKSKANITYTTPSHQFPLGLIMPAGRRFQLLKWANQKNNRFIIEDDYDSEFRYSGRPIPAIGGMANNEKTIYMGTFSKSISPSFRVSYLVLPPKLMNIYQNHLSYYSSTVSHFEQLLLANFIETGEFERHISRMRVYFRKKRDLLLSLLSPYSRYLQIRGIDAGMHILCTVHNGMPESNLVSTARKARIIVYGISEYYTDTVNSPEKYIPASTVLLGYAGLTDTEIEKGAAALISAWQLTL